MTLTFPDKVAIEQDVVLGRIPPASESDEAAAFRASLTRDFIAANAAGIMLDVPADWDVMQPDALESSFVGHAGRIGERGGSVATLEHADVAETRTERIAEPTKLEQGHYGNFVLNALAGRNPDEYYNEHQSDIDKVADYMREKYGPEKGGTIYRGIILDPSEVKDGVVQGVPEIKYVSFSADKEVAKSFGDTKNFMAEFMMKKYPNKQGYMIEQSYEPKQLLSHYTWAEHLPVPVSVAFGEDAKFTALQKEVMLKPQASYRVTPLAPGSSNSRVVGARHFNQNYALQAKAAGYRGIEFGTHGKE